MDNNIGYTNPQNNQNQPIQTSPSQPMYTNPPVAQPQMNGMPTNKNSQTKQLVAVLIGLVIVVIAAIIILQKPWENSAAPDNDTQASANSNTNADRPTSSTNQSTSGSSSAGANSTAVSATLNAGDLKEYSLEDESHKPYLGKRVAITGLLAWEAADDGSMHLSAGLLSMFDVTCSNQSSLGLANSTRYTITGVVDTNTYQSSYSWHLTNCTAIAE